MAQPPHLTHTVSSCRTQLTQGNPVSLTVTPVAPDSPSPSLLVRLSSVTPPQDGQTARYAVGTLKYRKPKNRKRTRMGDFVWSEEADLIFSLALINWTSDRTARLGSRRANFLQQFLARNGFLRTRKQIASRLQVLKGEWKATSYLNLLEDPERSSAKKVHVASPSPSTESEQDAPPSYSSLTPPTSSQPLHFGSEHGASVDVTPDEKAHFASLSMAFPPPPIDEDKLELRRILQLDDHGLSQTRSYTLGLVRDNRTAPAAPQVVTHHLPLHAPTAVVPGYVTSQNPLPRPVNHAPDFFGSQASRYNSHPSCVLCESQNALGAFYQPRPSISY